MAEPADADAAIQVVRDSITRLCGADHRNQPDLLAGWLKNKTAEYFCTWISNPDNYCVVAEQGELCGVGLLHRMGEVRLLYVSPQMQGIGVGRALMHRLEEHARKLNLAKVQLSSTAAARAFYSAIGYRDLGETDSWRGILCYKFEKKLIGGG
ncbi:MAG TPA: GNAT family N-acetyltransferase [Steroidobacteraceae bacterium]|nr:GNAT family N-acetyltransferase [Steroidobacteraceae bacterium]